MLIYYSVQHILNFLLILFFFIFFNCQQNMSYSCLIFKQFFLLFFTCKDSLTVIIIWINFFIIIFFYENIVVKFVYQHILSFFLDHFQQDTELSSILSKYQNQNIMILIIKIMKRVKNLQNFKKTYQKNFAIWLFALIKIKMFYKLIKK